MDENRLFDKVFSEAKKKKKRRGGPVPMNPRVVVMLVVEKIKSGDSQLKKVFERGYTIEQVIWAIKHHKCLADLGSTYLEQTIAGTIQDLIKERKLQKSKLNVYRQIFGLPTMQASDSQAQRPKPGHGRPNIRRGDKALMAKLRKALR